MKSARRNIVEPIDWWDAFDFAAAAAGVSLSEWLGDAGRRKLPPDLQRSLSVRPAAHRPKTPKENP